MEVITEEISFLEPGTAEWETAWAAMAARVKSEFGHTTDFADDYEGETWQYMGTYRGNHEFRHRAFRGQRTYLRIPAICGKTA